MYNANYETVISARQFFIGFQTQVGHTLLPFQMGNIHDIDEEISTRVSHRHQIQRLFFDVVVENRLDLFVLKGADGDGSESKGL